MAAGKPFITANQVTFLRLLLMPLPCWLLYQGQSQQFAALIFATLLGCTDFVDGYLARKYGSTVLGSLMDPIADKVFVAIAFLPAVDLKWVPAWTVAALFAREFLVTAARTSYEMRGQTLKSTYFARYKTWVQMCGIGILMLLHTVSRDTMRILLFIPAVAPVLAYAIRYVITKKTWKGAGWFAVSFAVLFGSHEIWSTQAISAGLMYTIVAVTWLSGIGYLVGLGQLAGKGRITAAELVRLGSSLAFPVLVVFAQAYDLAPKWALISLVSFELACGGLDNLLAHHRAQQGALAWGLRLGAECGLLAWSLTASSRSAAWWTSVGALALATIAIGILFWQKRSYYLDTIPKVPKGTPAQVVA